MPAPSTPQPLDKREYLLQRLQLVLKQIDPSYTFAQLPPALSSHRQLVTVLKGNVFTKATPELGTDESAMPLVLVVASPNTPDVMGFHDDNAYTRELRVELWGFCSGDDGGNRDSIVRAQLSALLADIAIAVEAFPYWTDGVVDPALQQLGAVVITPTRQEVALPVQTALGSCVAEYSIRYTFPKLWP